MKTNKFEILIVIYLFVVVGLMTFHSTANAGEIWLQIGGLSKHKQSIDPLTGREFNERHPGIGLEYHTEKLFYSISHYKNSYGRDLNSAVIARQWKTHFSENLKGSVQVGGGYYKYEKYGTYQYREYLVGHDDLYWNRTGNDPQTSRGFAPWLQTSVEYQRLGVNISYIPGGILGENSVSALAVQFKLKLN